MTHEFSSLTAGNGHVGVTNVFDMFTEVPEIIACNTFTSMGEMEGA